VQNSANCKSKFWYSSRERARYIQRKRLKSDIINDPILNGWHGTSRRCTEAFGWYTEELKWI